MTPAPHFQSNPDTSALSAPHKVRCAPFKLVRACLPPTPVTKIRCYYWLPDTPLQNEPLTQAAALASAKSMDLDFDSRAPSDIVKALPETAFAFQFVHVGTTVPKLNRVLQVFGAAARYDKTVEPQIYLVGDVDISMKGDLMLCPKVGNYFIVAKDAMMLRPDDLRPYCSHYDPTAPRAASLDPK